MLPRVLVGRTALVGAVVTAALVAGCSPPASDGGTIVVTTDDRIAEVRAARDALAGPVPAVAAEAERLVLALEELWTLPDAADVRADRAAALQLAPLRQAAADLAAVELDGDGPDVEAARDLVAAIGADVDALLAAAEAEVATLTDLPAFDGALVEVLETWDERGSYSQQLNAFDGAAQDAERLAGDAAGRSGTPSCVEVWPRRATAATTVAERTRELYGLVRDRRGQEFDELRDAYRQDPYGLGARLGELDAAAAACWADASDAPVAMALLQERVDELAAALDPADLQG